MRLVAVVKNGTVEYLSRSGKPADQWNGLFDEELVKMEKRIGRPIIVDGEALAEDFQATAKAKGSKNDKSGMKFFVFDYMLLDEWQTQKCDINQVYRTKALDHMIKSLGLTKIVKSTSKLLNNIEEAKAFYTEVIELGLPGQDEGLIIKQLDGKYEWNSEKRTMTWAKWKPVIDVDVEIVGCFEGKGKNLGRLGGFYVEGYDENKNHIKSRCGGFKVNSKQFKDWIAKFAKAHNIDLVSIYAAGVSRDEFFRTFAWKNQGLFVGSTAMIETQELSLAQDSDTYSLRFPQFLSIRNDK
jgi:ATP-dependent DNA ligase